MAKAKKTIGRPFAKGQSGNPSGRSKKRQEIEALAQSICEAVDKDTKRTLIDELGQMARTEEKAADKHRAIELLMGYAYGKPRQRTEVTGGDGGGILVQFVKATK